MLTSIIAKFGTRFKTQKIAMTIQLLIILLVAVLFAVKPPQVVPPVDQPAKTRAILLNVNGNLRILEVAR